jgi:hypothetical protein
MKFTRKYVILIGANIGIGILLYFLSTIVFQEFPKLDSKLKDLITMSILAVLGLTLFAIRDKRGVDKNLVDSLEVLLLIIFPTISAFALFTKPSEKFIFATIPYFITVSLWYVFFVRRIYKKKEMVDSNLLNRDLVNEISDKKASKSTHSLTVLWGILIVYGITAIWLTLQLLPYLNE